MLKKVSAFYIKSLNNFFKAIINIFIFLPYFFSVKTLLKTLFYPWKNINYSKTIDSFSISFWLEKNFFNLISIIIGFFMRFSLLSFYVLVQILFLIIIPIIFFVYFIFIAVFSLISLFQKTIEEKKQEALNKFIKFHLLTAENKNQVIAWFEEYYQEKEKRKKWWLKENLFLIPPLARDWAYGYTYFLDHYSEELTDSLYIQSKPSIVDREKEIKAIEEVLSKSRLNNVLIVGEDGVGKHTIVDSLAYRIYHGTTTNQLMYHRILKLDMEKILNEYQDQVKREFFLEQLLKEAVEAKNIIIFIDDIDRYLSYGEGRVDLSLVIKKFAQTEKLQIIGITNHFFYQKFIFPNEKINQIFSKVDVFEISKEFADKILQKIALKFELKYNLFISYEAIIEVIEKSSFYITDIPFPEKAIDLLDLSCIKAKEKEERIVTPDLINQTLSQKTHIPTSFTDKIKEKLINLESFLKNEIINQDEAVKKLTIAIKRAFVLQEKRNKPLSTFLFLGPTGVGKTQTAKALCQYFFGSQKYLIRLDMSEYQIKEDIGKLIGQPDSRQPGLLSKAIRETPFAVLLLDELEKANPDLLNIFLTILDEGYFTDGAGKKVDCKNLIVIATSNAGSDLLYQIKQSISFDNLIDILIKNRLFTPEFLNRFDGIILFNSLSNESLFAIGKKIIAQMKKNIYSLYKINFSVSDDYLKKLIDKSVNPRFGARDLERIIKENIENKIINLILENKIAAGENIFLEPNKI